MAGKRQARSYRDSHQKRQSKEDKVQQKRETSAAVGTIISGNTERNLLGEGWAAAVQHGSVEDCMLGEA